MNKKQWLRRALALALTLVMATLALAGYAEEQATLQPGDDAVFGVTEAEVERKVYPYVKDFGKDEIERDEVALYYVNGGEIPYVALSEYMELLTELLEKGDGREGIAYKVERDGEHIYAVSRTDRNSMMSVNTEINLIWFLDFNSFTQKSDVTASVTMTALPEPVEVDFDKLLEAITTMDPEEGQQYFMDMLNARQPAPESLFTADAASINRVGEPLALNLSDYGIDIVEHDGECYIPLQTLNDLFMGGFYMRYVFNGIGLYAFPYGHDGLLEEVYQAEPQEMSEEFAQFNYGELLFMLDSFYGLKPEHDIEAFSELLGNTQLAWKMSTQSEDVDEAISQLCMTYLDDMHSSFNSRSWRSNQEVGGNVLDALSKMGFSNVSHTKTSELFANARRAAFPDGLPMYQEIGDTAFITFDQFVGQDDSSYYYHMDEPQADEFFMTFISPEEQLAQGEALLNGEEVQPQEAQEPVDTIRLFNYAYKQITREDSPIKNVVIDLSNNGGGATNAAIYVVAMVLGQANIALKDTFTGAETIMRIGADLEFNEDYKSYQKALVPLGYKVWCLTCLNSFSCGNLVPAALKMSERVPIVGQRSGGGSCVVLPCSTASGTLFQISGNLQLSTVRNGSFYNIDQGVEPDVPLMWPESYYDREALVEYLNTLK